MGRLALLFVALLSAGIGAGSAYATYFDLDQADSTPAFWVAHLQHAVRHIGIPLFVVQPVAALASFASAALSRRDRPSFWFLIAGGVSLVVAALVTRLGNLPINFEFETWDADALPANVAEVQQRWWSFHVVRCVLLVVAMSALILGTLTRRPETRATT